MKTAAVEAGIALIRKAVRKNYATNMEAGWQTDTSQYVKLVNDQEDQSSFLKEVDMVRVNDTAGPLRRFKLTGSSEGRLEVRTPKNLAQFDGRTYDLTLVDNDFVIPYSDLDSYTKVGKPADYVKNVNQGMATKIGEDELFVAFNGTSRAQWASDIDMLDMDKGWLQRIRDEAPAQIIDEIRAGTSIVTYGPPRKMTLSGAAVDKTGGKTGLPCVAHGYPTGALIYLAGTTSYNGAYTVDPDSNEDEVVIVKAFAAETFDPATALLTCIPDFPNLDTLTSNAVSSIHKNKRKGLKALMSDTMAGAEKASLLAGISGTPTEKRLVDVALGTVGSLPKRTPFAFPDQTIMIANPKNLQIYLHQIWRRKMKDSEEDRGLSSWNERKRDFIVSDYEAVMLIENIVEVTANPAML